MSEPEKPQSGAKMTPDVLRAAARDQLNLVLGFFSRVDTRASVALGLNTGMLALLSGRAPSLGEFSWPALVIVLPIALISVSLYHLYRAGFPNFRGGHASLIYFREIAQRTEHNFIPEFMGQSEQAYVKDLLGQVWRNSEILTEKFERVKKAYIFLGLAILPWVVTLMIFATYHSQMFTTK